MLLELQNPVDEEERAFPEAIYIYLSTLIESYKDHKKIASQINMHKHMKIFTLAAVASGNL